jgi:hypothetical protein
MSNENVHRCERALEKLLSYCRSQGWAGYDPYDGLASPVGNLPPLRNKLMRTVLIQAVKRSPLNLRPLLGIKRRLNPKGIALAARAVVLLLKRTTESLPANIEQTARREVLQRDFTFLKRDFTFLERDFTFLISALEDLRSRDYEEACWGYNFDWQSRAFFAPRGTPNVVCTVTAAQAFLDWHDLTGCSQGLDLAASSAGFLLDRLNRTEHCFSYTPLDRSQVHNVNLLAAELLARLFVKTRQPQFRDAAEKAVEFTISKQRADGSWPYGEGKSQGWIDGFHTGFILVSLKHIIDYLGESRWQEGLFAGFKFYEERFFLADSTPKYYHDRLYPVDVHSAAQAVITFSEMAETMPHAFEMASRAVNWSIDNLQDVSGYFYFQKHRLYTIRTPFIRWAQAWMLYALGLYLSRSATGENV